MQHKKTYKKFYELEIWNMGYALQKELFELTATYPSDERFGLITQTNNASNSIIANIAESHGRYYYMDRVRVLYISRGELEEVQSHLITAQSRGYVSKEVCHAYVVRYEELKKKLNRYIQDQREQGKRAGTVEKDV